MMPSCDQIGVPLHFHSSTTSGSASLMSLRILLRVSPRQSPSSAILFEMSSDAGWPWLAPGFFIFSSIGWHTPFLLSAAQRLRLAMYVTSLQPQQFGGPRDVPVGLFQLLENVLALRRLADLLQAAEAVQRTVGLLARRLQRN